MSELFKIAGAVLLPNLVVFSSASLTGKHTQLLIKPTFQPPNWVFAPTWTAVCSGMGYASYLLWRDSGGLNDARNPLTFYAALIALNWAYRPLLFGQCQLRLDYVDHMILIAVASVCGVLFYKTNKVAGCLFVPYLAWLSFASILSYSIDKLN